MYPVQNLPPPCPVLVYHFNDAGITVRVPAVSVNQDAVKLRFLLLGIGGKVIPAVICAGKQRVIKGDCVLPLHVVVHMGERPISANLMKTIQKVNILEDL